NYGSDIYGKFKLPELIGDISKIDKIKWIRILYCYPDHITDELLQEIKNNPKVVKYFDIPLQHVDGKILKQMNRTGDMKSIAALLHKIRSIIPEAVIRTTFILGFPGESGAQFETLCQFAEDHKFERLGCFTYSQEENTKAAQLPDQIDYEIKATREQTLMDIQSLIIDGFSASLVGKTFEVLIEKLTKDGNFVGRTYMDAPDVDGMVYFNGNSNCKIGDFVKVQIDDYEDYELFGHLIK
ncbi:MAG: TRAM domain-containing protein, partial [Oscillospiraceae bacterium]